MKVAGAAAVGSVALPGTAGAHVADCVYFCGCGRLVAYRKDKDGEGLPAWYPVLVAKEGDGEGPPELRHYLVEGENRNLEFTNRGRGKILGFGVEDTFYYNPNQCAQKVFKDNEYGDDVQSTVQNYFDVNDAREDAENEEDVDNDDDGYDYVAFGDPEDRDDFLEGRKGHCHPPRDDQHCAHDRGADSNGRSTSNGRSNGPGGR